MALTQAHLDALETAIASGELTVEYDGKRVTYRSISDLKAAADYVRSQIADQSAEGRAEQTLATFSRE